MMLGNCCRSCDLFVFKIVLQNGSTSLKTSTPQQLDVQDKTMVEKLLVPVNGKFPKHSNGTTQPKMLHTNTNPQENCVRNLTSQFTAACCD